MTATITALRFQKRNPERVNVYLDGSYAFGLPALIAASLRIGQSLGEDEIASLQGQDAAQRAYERALRFLASRPRSSARYDACSASRSCPPKPSRSSSDACKTPAIWMMKHSLVSG